MCKLALFLMSSGLKWLFSIMASPAHLMNNLGCDWALPDGWNEMPPLAFQQLGEVVIPTGWWWLFWITGAHEEPTKYPWAMCSSCVRAASRLHFPSLTPRSRLCPCIHAGSGETFQEGTVSRAAVACLGPSTSHPLSPPPPCSSWGRMDPQAAQWQLAAEGDCGMSSLLVPSPQSEAVTHEMEELSLQPTQSLPPLSERKNGKDMLPHRRPTVWIH